MKHEREGDERANRTDSHGEQQNERGSRGKTKRVVTLARGIPGETDTLTKRALGGGGGVDREWAIGELGEGSTPSGLRKVFPIAHTHVALCSDSGTAH